MKDFFSILPQKWIYCQENIVYIINHQPKCDLSCILQLTLLKWIANHLTYIHYLVSMTIQQVSMNMNNYNFSYIKKFNDTHLLLMYFHVRLHLARLLFTLNAWKTKLTIFNHYWVGPEFLPIVMNGHYQEGPVPWTPIKT